MAAGAYHSVAVLTDGSVLAWGDNGDGQCNVAPLPAGLTYVGVAAAYLHTVALRSDGSVVAWGDNAYGQCTVPPLPAGVTCVEVAAGGFYSAVRRSDGAVVAWGDNTSGQCNVPALPPGASFAEIALGGAHGIARLSDGSVISWGGSYGPVSTIPAGHAFGDVSAGHIRSVGLYGPVGSVLTIGSGCGAAGSPTLMAGAPRIGQPIGLLLTQGTPAATGFLFAGLVAPTPLALGSGCTVFVDLATATPLLPVTAAANGTWTAAFGVPADPFLFGLQAALQVALFPTLGPLGLDLTNGVIATVGY